MVDAGGEVKFIVENGFNPEKINNEDMFSNIQYLDESDAAFEAVARERGYRKMTLGEQFIEFGMELAGKKK